MISFGVLLVGGAVVLAMLAAIIGGVVFLIGASKKTASRRTDPDEFPDAVCDSCAASLTRGMKNCPNCGQSVRP
ncbi:MAG: hypothetical protein NT069_09425 [Planctomycetota bacterium]|nr:hypothetical protein [Planctomycetota bacterium]